MKRRIPACEWLAPFTIVVLFALGALQSYAQPKISYLIPDLGTTRYGTYIEVIGPHNANGGFGTDGTYLNNPGDAVRVRCERSADTLLIKIGPCVVSWDGRMISTIVYVLPTVAPNSEDWTKLDPKYRIPLVVEVNGVTSQPDTFYIVKPWPIGDKRGNADRVIGEGSLGRRSKRGAMLIDSFLLAGADYTVSTADCDASKPGNQGYLPYTLLSPGRIVGQVGSNIRASASGADGGPGGGGGGGAYYNVLVAGSSGTAGGNGFTGGGPGGENAPFNGSSRRKPGVGSGESLGSGTVGSPALNGTLGGDATSAYENAGGGTGHPFGQSGVGCDQKDNCNTSSAYGGGSGAREGIVGSSAGFGEDGIPSPGQSNQGLKHGNAMLVPLAGGSGGASGNPSGLTGLSSNGGGGGGAVSMHARLLAQFDVWAVGGTTSINGVAAGGGSGGGIILGSRLDNTSIGSAGGQTGTPDRPPHLKGGTGRLRLDVWIGKNAGWFLGPLSDTTTQSLRDVDIVGHANGETVNVYLKSEHSPWILIDSLSGYGGTWHFVNRLPGTDTLYFIAFGQRNPNAVTGAYTDEPSMVLSQSAWNIVRLKGPPVIQADSVRNLGAYRCPNEVVTDTITITNRGESPLEISSASWTGASGFRLVSPSAFPDSIASNTSKKYVVEYVAQTGQNGPLTGTLVLDNTDTVKARDPWRVRFNVDVRLVDLHYKFRGEIRDTIDIGAICVNTALSDQIVVENVGLDSVRLLSYKSADLSMVEVSANLPFTVPVSGFRNLSFTIIAKHVGQAVVPTLLAIEGCAEPDTVWIKYHGVAPSMTLVGTGQFGVVPVGGSRQLLIQIRNDGSSDLEIPALPTVLPPFQLISAVPGPPAILQPGQTMDLVYEYRPTIVGTNQATFWIHAIGNTASGGRSCPDSVEVILAGTAQAADVVASPGSLNFPPTRTCADTILTVAIENVGAVAVKLSRPAFINGLNSADYSVVREPLADTTLQPGGKAFYDVRFAPTTGAATIRTAVLSVRTDAPGLPQIDVPLNGQVATIDLTGPRYIDLGLVPIGSTATQTVQYVNNTGADVTITQIRSTRPSTTTTPTSFTVANGATQSVDVSTTPTIETSTVDTLWFVSDAPCADSFPVLVRWTSESGSIGITNTLAFGLLSNCATKVDTCYVTNTSKVNVDVIDAVITGADANVFTILNPAIATNVTLTPGQRIGIAVQFDPRGGTDGPKSASLTVRARIANQPTGFICSLSGTRATSIPSTPSPVAFGLVDVQQTSAQTLTIVNTGLLPVRITSIALRGTSGGVFTFTGPGLPTTLQPGDRVDIQIAFTPTDRIVYTDSLLIEFDQPCADVKTVALTGTGRLNVEIAVRMPFLRVSPAEDNLEIPIRAEIMAGAVSTISADVHLIIRNITSVYVVHSITPGTIVRNESTGGITELEVLVPGVTITDQESVIATLHGQATLGMVDSTDIDLAFAELTASGATYTTRPEDGWVILEICREGGDRLVKKSGSLNVQPLPSPVNEVLTVHSTVFERGRHTLEILDMNGQVLDQIGWEHTPGQEPQVSQFDVRRLASGPYTIRLTTPTRQRVAQIMVIH